MVNVESVDEWNDGGWSRDEARVEMKGGRGGVMVAWEWAKRGKSEMLHDKLRNLKGLEDQESKDAI